MDFSYDELDVLSEALDFYSAGKDGFHRTTIAGKAYNTAREKLETAISDATVRRLRHLVETGATLGDDLATMTWPDGE